MNKTNELGSKPIGQLLAQYSIPAVVAMLVNAIYNVVDRIFIGQYAGENALAGLTMAFPIMLMIFAFASLIGIGGSSLLSIRFGEKDQEGANHVFGNTLSFGLLITTITLISIFLNLQGLLRLFGATDEILNYGTIYMQIILGGFIFQMLSFILNSAVRTEGQPLFSMFAMMTSAIVNIIFDYLFIAILDMGVAGAAYATILGQFSGLCILLSYYLRGKSSLKLKLNHLIPDLKVITSIVSIGFATFISTVGTSVAMAFMNRGLADYGGAAAITSMGAINSLYTFFIMPIMGMTQGMQPIIGYNHGANDRSRVNKTLTYGLAIGVLFSSTVFVLLQLFPTTFISLFLEPGSDTIAIAVNGLRIFILMLPLLSVNLMGVAYYQSTAQGRTSMFLSSLRQFIFLIPLVLILPLFFGLNGVWFATAIADGLAILTTAIILFKDLRRDKATTDTRPLAA